MKEKISKFFKSEYALKVLSLLLAIAAWFTVISATNPLEQTTVNIMYSLEASGQQVETQNGITLMNTNSVSSRIEVMVKGRQESLTNVRSEDINISLDLSEVTASGVQEVPVVVKPDKVGITVSDYSPKTISINFEKIIEATFPVTVEVEDGVLQDGFVVAQTSVNPETIQLRGFESIISKISTVEVVVEAVNIDSKIEHSKTFRMICKYYDAAGEEVTGLTGIETVDVSIIAGREVTLKPNIIGNLAEDCYIKETNITPQKVIVIGPSTTLVDLVSLDTTEIDLEDVNENVTQVVDVVLPYGVSLADISIRPTVTIKVGGIIEKHFSINSDNITLSGTAEQYVYTINSTTDLTLKGKDAELEKVNASALKGTANVSGYGPGTYDILVSMKGLPSGITIPSGGYAKVNVTIRAATVETPEPSVTPTPTPTPDVPDEPTTVLEELE